MERTRRNRLDSFGNMSENKQVYKISFLNEGKVYEIYAKRVS